MSGITQYRQILLSLVAAVALCQSAVGQDRGAVFWRSQQSDEPAVATWKNTTTESQKLYWLDMNGRQQFYRNIAPEEVYSQDTFYGHAWRTISASGRVQNFVLTRGSTHFNIGNFDPMPKPIPEPIPEPTPVGRPQTFTITNLRAQDLEVKLSQPDRRVVRKRVPAGQSRKIDVHVGWKLIGVQSGRLSSNFKRPILKYITISGSANQMGVSMSSMPSPSPQPVPAPGPGPMPMPAPVHYTTFPEAVSLSLQIQVRDLGGNRMLVTDAGHGRGRTLLNNGDIIGFCRVDHIPMPGARVSELKLTSMEVLPAAGGHVHTIHVERRIGKVVISRQP